MDEVILNDPMLKDKNIVCYRDDEFHHSGADKESHSTEFFHVLFLKKNSIAAASMLNMLSLAANKLEMFEQLQTTRFRCVQTSNRLGNRLFFKYLLNFVLTKFKV